RLRLRTLPEGTPALAGLPSVEQARHMEERARRLYDRLRRAGRGASAEELEKAELELRGATAGREQAMLEALTALATARLRHAQMLTVKQKPDDTRVVVPDQTLRRPQTPPRSGAKLPELPPVEFVVVQRLVAEGEMVRAFPSTTVFKL